MIETVKITDIGRVRNQERHLKKNANYVSPPPLSSTKMSLCDRSCKRRASISLHPARSKGHGHKGRQIGPPIGAGRPNARAPHEVQTSWQKGLCGKGKKEKLEEAEKKRIIDALIEKLKDHELAADGLTTLIQRCEEK